jgi:DNA gyrase subunit A
VLAAAFIPAEEKESAMVYTYTGRSQKLTPVELNPVKGRATGGSRVHTFKKGEDRLIFAAIAVNPTVVDSGGKLVTLPPVATKRDGSGMDTIETPAVAGR